MVVEELSTAVLSHSSISAEKETKRGSGQLSEQPEGLAAAEPNSTRLHTIRKLGLPWSSSSRVVPEQAEHLQLLGTLGDLLPGLLQRLASSSHPR